MPKDFSDVVRLSALEINKLLEEKNLILKLFPLLNDVSKLKLMKFVGCWFQDI